MSNGKTEVATGCMGILLMFAILAAIGAFCWPYTLNAWLAFFGKDIVIVWWQGLLLGFVPGIGQASIPAAVITWILMLFLG